MKIAVIVVRSLIGLLFLFASLAYFLGSAAPPESFGNAKIFMDGVAASGYILPIVRTLELVCGLAFLINRFVALALILIFPIVINILFINALLLTGGLPIALTLFAGILFLTYAHRQQYEPLLAAR